MDYQKGDFYSNEKLCLTLGEESINEFELLALQARIQEETGFTVKIENAGLRILTSSEASEYNNHRFGLSLKAMYRRHNLMMRINRSELTEDDSRHHDRRIEVQSKILQSITPVIIKELPMEIPYKVIPKVLRDK